MFESSLKTILHADTVLAGYVTTYGAGAAPSIFSDFAPEGAELPYLVYKINYWNNQDVVIHRFSVVFDFYDYNVSAANARAAAFRLQYLLDHRKIESTRYGAIRFFMFGGERVIEDDPRAIHYNIEFDCRAGRKAWGAHNITTEE